MPCAYKACLSLTTIEYGVKILASLPFLMSVCTGLKYALHHTIYLKNRVSLKGDTLPLIFSICEHSWGSQALPPRLYSGSVPLVTPSAYDKLLAFKK